MGTGEPVAVLSSSGTASNEVVLWHEFPDCCLRGLRSPKFVNSENEIHSDAFDAPKDTLAKRLEKGLPPGEEVSVNWHLDAGAAEVTFRDKQNSAAGAARVPTEEVKRIADRTGAVLPEWDKLDGNHYHGNIVYRAGITTQRKRQIQGSLALHATYTPRPEK